jgi:hypothetical protein
MTLHPGITKNATHLVNHRFLVRITEANDLDRFWVAVLGSVLGSKGEGKILRQIPMVRLQGFIFHARQRIVAGKSEDHPDAVVFILR